MKLSFFRCLGAFAFLASAHARIQGKLVRDIPATAKANGQFKTLVAALGAAGLDSALSVPGGPFTVFAPPDTAFASLPAGLVDCLLLPQNMEALKSILTYHVVSGEVTSNMLQTAPVTTLNREAINVDTSNGVTLNGSTKVITADVAAFNGVIHIIDSVLVPPSIDVDAFMATCPPPTTAGTPPAPSPGQPIKGQVISGQTGTPPEEANTAVPPTAPSPGQPIKGQVISGQTGTPPEEANTAVTPPAPSPGQPIKGQVISGQPGTPPKDVALVSIPQTALNNGFNTLVQAVGDANLTGALSGTGPFTVFAPTDTAFAGLQDGLVSCLLLPSNKEVLTALLQYHVVSGKFESGDLSNGAVPTLNGANITVDLSNGVQIKGSNTVTVTMPDVQATNGVIHVIDGVLVPPAPFDLEAFIATCPPPPPPPIATPGPATTPASSNSMKMRTRRQTEEKKKANSNTEANLGKRSRRNRRL